MDILVNFSIFTLCTLPAYYGHFAFFLMHAILRWQMAISQSFALMAQAWVRMSQWPSFKPTFKWKVHCQWKWHQSRMGGILLKIEERMFIGTRRITPSWRSIFIPEQWRKRKSTPGYRWTSILRLFYCSDHNSLSKWDITNDTDGNISMTSPATPSSWVGAELTRSSVRVLWRLIPADRQSY